MKVIMYQTIDPAAPDTHVFVGRLLDGAEFLPVFGHGETPEAVTTQLQGHLDARALADRKAAERQSVLAEARARKTAEAS